MNFLLNELVDILEKESHAAKSLTASSPEKFSNGSCNGHANGVKKEPLVTWVHKNFQVKYLTVLKILSSFWSIYNLTISGSISALQLTGGSKGGFLKFLSMNFYTLIIERKRVVL